MSLRVAPEAAYPRQTQPELGAPSAPGVHDTLRSRLNLSAAAPSSSDNAQAASKALQSTHPLEARLRSWRTTQDELKSQLLRRQFGLAEPVKRAMELNICNTGDWRPACLGADGRTGGVSGVHADILSGRDTEMDWEDVFVAQEQDQKADFHTEVEARMRMNWS